MSVTTTETRVHSSGHETLRIRWLHAVRKRRNAVHCFQDHDIGNWAEWQKAVLYYHFFLLELHDSVPYPEDSEYFRYPSDIREMSQDARAVLRNAKDATTESDDLFDSLVQRARTGES